MYCKQCGALINENERFCSNCGCQNEMNIQASANSSFQSIVNGSDKTFLERINKTRIFSIVGAVMGIIGQIAYIVIFGNIMSDNDGGGEIAGASVLLMVGTIINIPTLIYLGNKIKALTDLSKCIEANNLPMAVDEYFKKDNKQLSTILLVANLCPLFSLITIVFTIAQALAIISNIKLRKFYEQTYLNEQR